MRTPDPNSTTLNLYEIWVLSYNELSTREEQDVFGGIPHTYVLQLIEQFIAQIKLPRCELNPTVRRARGGSPTPSDTELTITSSKWT